MPAPYGGARLAHGMLLAWLRPAKVAASPVPPGVVRVFTRQGGGRVCAFWIAIPRLWSVLEKRSTDRPNSLLVFW